MEYVCWFGKCKSSERKSVEGVKAFAGAFGFDGASFGVVHCVAC